MHLHSHTQCHTHGSHHGHAQRSGANFTRAFALGVTLNVVFVVIEFICGSLVNSLALLADAGHNLSDVFGLLLAWGAHYLSGAKPSNKRTYGWKSSSILAALFNAQLLLIAVGGIVWEAVGRLASPTVTGGTVIMWVAMAGVVINTSTALLFFSGRKGDLNVRGAYLHMAADAGVSLGVVFAGLAITWTGSHWIDPMTSMIVALVILLSTWSLLRESLDLALHAVPRHIDLDAVKALLSALPNVIAIHDLHIWAMSTTETALTAHLVVDEPHHNDQLLAAATRALQQRFSIEHATLQIENTAAASHCRQASDGVV